MKLSKHQFCTYLDELYYMWNEEKHIADSLEVVEWAPGRWINTFYEFFIDMCEVEDDPICGDIISWFIFEADWGTDRNMNKIYITEEDRTWNIESPEILYDYIMEYEAK